MDDRREVIITGGPGGHGRISFSDQGSRYKGGPDGGIGGMGGLVIVTSTPSRRDFHHFGHVEAIEGNPGEPGGTNGRTGRDGRPFTIEVPLGTTVVERTEDGEDVELADLLQPGANLLIARGGPGGKGNTGFATSTNQTPVLAEAGAEGEERQIVLELRLDSDVALIGAPNVGKSALLAALSNARPRVADYPFTTVDPVHGVLDLGDRDILLLELPGLSEGARGGRGLGSAHLRHARRAQGLAYVLDGAAGDVVEEYRIVHREVAAYGEGLTDKPALVIVTKADLPEVAGGLERALRAVRRASKARVVGVSAVSGDGLEGLRSELARLAPPRERQRGGPQRTEAPPVPVRPGRVVVSVRDGVFEVSAPRAERILPMVDVKDWRARLQLHAELGRLGVLDALEKHGVQTGDTVRIGGEELLWE